MKAETDLIHENRPNNIEKDYHHVFGDPEKGFAEADYVDGSALHRERSDARGDGAALTLAQFRNRSAHRASWDG